MKAIFLCENTDKIFRVYDADTRLQLQKLTGIEERLYAKADILGDPSRFADVEFIFSTFLVCNHSTCFLCP